MTTMKNEKSVVGSEYCERMDKWLNIINEIMPVWFFKTFSSRDIVRLLPALLTLEECGEPQFLLQGSALVIVYFKGKEYDHSIIDKRLEKSDITGAYVYESKSKIIVNGSSTLLAVEMYQATESDIVTPALYAKKNVVDECRRKFKLERKVVENIYSRLNWNFCKDLSLENLAGKINYVARVQDQDHMILGIEKKDTTLKLIMALSHCPSKGFFTKYLEVFRRHGFRIQRSYMRKMTGQVNTENFREMAVSVNSFYLYTNGALPKIDSRRVRALLADLEHIKWVCVNDMVHEELVVNRGWSIGEANLIRAAGDFVQSQLVYVDPNAYTANEVTRLMLLYQPILEECLKLFEALFDPKNPAPMQAKAQRLNRKIIKSVETVRTGVQQKDKAVRVILNGVRNFFESIVKTNYYVKEKSTLSFRMKPEFMDYYKELSNEYAEDFKAADPYGVFYFHRENAIGFQVRFANIARGGWRTVVPSHSGQRLERMDAFRFARNEVFREVFVLAHTQHLKNKDIYEGGSKMICLLNHDNQPMPDDLFVMQRSVCRAFLDLINYSKAGKLVEAVVDLAGSNEIIEIGPDENMLDPMITWMGEYAAKVGYCLSSGLISGKPERGFNHKELGVTSFGVHQYLLKTLVELDIDVTKDEFSIKISGGPYGDVAGNALKLLLGNNEYPGVKIVAITDGPAAAYDPDGLDKKELLRLVHKSGLDKFDWKKLKGEGAFIVLAEIIDKNGIECHNRYTVKNGKVCHEYISRDQFQSDFSGNMMVHAADVFMPCGGRPRTIDKYNWREFCPDGVPSAKAIVEGANSFITPEARKSLQSEGVWIIKDASANKCGVITSSYEIISGLLLAPAEFDRLKSKLVQEVMEILQERSRHEADWLYKEFRDTGVPLTELTERLSRAINSKNEEISAWLEINFNKIPREVMMSHLPPAFKSMEAEVIKKLPFEYQKAIVSVELASRIIYSGSRSLLDEIKQVL